MVKGIAEHNSPLLSSMICIANPTIHYPHTQKRKEDYKRASKVSKYCTTQSNFQEEKKDSEI